MNTARNIEARYEGWGSRLEVTATCVSQLTSVRTVGVVECIKRGRFISSRLTHPHSSPSVTARERTHSSILLSSVCDGSDTTPYIHTSTLTIPRLRRLQLKS